MPAAAAGSPPASGKPPSGGKGGAPGGSLAAGAVAPSGRPLYKPTGYEKARGAVGTLEEWYQGKAGGEVGTKLYDIDTLNDARVGKAKTEPAVRWAQELTGRKTWGFLKSVLGEGRAATISRALRGVPWIGEAFGVARSRYGVMVDAAEAIEKLVGGKPKFGTEELIRRGKTKSKVTRYTEAEGKAIWNGLELKEQKAVLSWVKRREHLQQLYQVATEQEGYFKRIFEDLEEVGGDVDLLWRQKKAVERKTRAGGVKGYSKDFEKGVVSYEQGLALEKQWNDNIAELVDEAGRDWPAGSSVPDGWRRVPDEVDGVATIGAGKIIPNAFYDRWIAARGAGTEMGKAMGLVKGLGNYVKTVVLSSPKTLLRNVIGGGAQYAMYATEQFFRSLVTLNPRHVAHAMMAPFEALLPRMWDEIPPWALGTGAGGEIKVAGKLKGATDAALAAYSSVENFWKRSIAISELRGRGLKATAEVMTATRDLNAGIRKAVDAFGFDYKNIHPTLTKFRDHPLSWAMVMFPVYPYKYARLFGRYLGAFNPLQQMSRVDRAARILTLGSGLAAAYQFFGKQQTKELPGIPGLPPGMENSGAVLKEDEKSEWRLDISDIAGAGWLEAVGRGDPDMLLDRAGGGVGAPGPAAQFLTFWFGDKEKRAGRLGTMAGTLLVPGGRVTRDVKKLNRASGREEALEKKDKKKAFELMERAPATFKEGFSQFVPGMDSKKTGMEVPAAGSSLQALEASTGVRVTKTEKKQRLIAWLRTWKTEMEKATKNRDRDGVKRLKEKLIELRAKR